jgi:hypothetical protein
MLQRAQGELWAEAAICYAEATHIAASRVEIIPATTQNMKFKFTRLCAVSAAP